MNPEVIAQFDEETNTVTYIVIDPESRRAAIVDPVLDFDPKAGATSTASADKLIRTVEHHGLAIDWILETHVHADHLTAAPYLQDKLGGKIGIGEHIGDVQRRFAELFDVDAAALAAARPFDQQFGDGETFRIGGLEARAIHTPGHTPADMTYVVGEAAFVGDTLFQPDYGTARADFPGGDARALYRSIRRLLDELPPETRLFTCHDYTPAGREHHVWESTVDEQRRMNVHVRDGVSEQEFVDMRTARDAKLEMPRLILPSVQVNMRGGRLPEAEANGIRYLKLPLDALVPGPHALAGSVQQETGNKKTG